jgi:hypothetical protein
VTPRRSLAPVLTARAMQAVCGIFFENLQFMFVVCQLFSHFPGGRQGRALSSPVSVFPLAVPSDPPLFQPCACVQCVIVDVERQVLVNDDKRPENRAPRSCLLCEAPRTHPPPMQVHV